MLIKVLLRECASNLVVWALNGAIVIQAGLALEASEALLVVECPLCVHLLGLKDLNENKSQLTDKEGKKALHYYVPSRCIWDSCLALRPLPG